MIEMDTGSYLEWVSKETFELYIILFCFPCYIYYLHIAAYTFQFKETHISSPPSTYIKNGIWGNCMESFKTSDVQTVSQIYTASTDLYLLLVVYVWCVLIVLIFPYSLRTDRKLNIPGYIMCRIHHYWCTYLCVQIVFDWHSIHYIYLCDMYICCGNGLTYPSTKILYKRNWNL